MEFVKPHIYFIALSFLASLLVYQKPQQHRLYVLLFPPFLLISLIIELYGAYQSYYGRHTVDVYNFFTVFEFCFYLVAISLIISSKSVKIITWIATLLYAIGAITNIIVVHKISGSFHITSYAVGCVIVVVFCFYYFLELFRLPKSVNLISNPAFWICSGLLFFYICGFAVYGFINELANVQLIAKNFETIITMLNIFLYSLFTIAFLCTKTRKYTLSPS